MRTAVLVPLYRPSGKHILLLQSAVSACPAGEGYIFLIAADGPNSAVTWHESSLLALRNLATAKKIELLFYSYLHPNGYPGCFQKLIADALQIPNVRAIHFIDQDDYCLPGRFLNRDINNTTASSALVVDVNFNFLTAHRFDESIPTGLLETPAPGMTFSTSASTARDYLKLCDALQEARTAPHDYVISQLAIRDETMTRATGASMLYVQHTENTIGHVRGFRWFFKKLATLRQVLQRTLRHARILDQIYGSIGWQKNPNLHRSTTRSHIYVSILKLLR